MKQAQGTASPSWTLWRYKIIRLKIDHSGNFLDSEFAGPYVGLTVGF